MEQAAMQRSRNATRLALLMSVFLVLGAGCAGPLVKAAPVPPTQFERLGPTEGTACGFLGFANSTYYLFPIMLGSRVQRAHDKALASAPGATALVDVELRERWFWWIVGTHRCTTIRGEAIR
jgi:hypothetical protein